MIIFTVCYNTPKFVEYQYLLLKKFLKDDFKYIVYNNTCTNTKDGKIYISEDDKNNDNELNLICKKYKIKNIKIPSEIYGVPYKKSLYYPNNNVSTRAGISISYSVQDVIKNLYKDEIGFLIDSDMFLINEFSILKNMEENDISGIYQNRENINYFTNQLFIFRINNIKKENLKYINFMPRRIDNINIDCGADLYYLLKNQKDLKINKFYDIIHNDTIKNIEKLKNENNSILDYFNNDLKIVRKTYNESNDDIGYHGELYDKVFLHFRAGTNWREGMKYSERTINLFNYLNTLIDIKIESNNIMKKIISFSIYNKRPKDILGVICNCLLSPIIYPGWICRIYYDNSVPKECIDLLNFLKEEKILGHSISIELIDMSNHWLKGHNRLMWRFLPISDDDVEISISRDGDSLISMREKVCVDDWLKSDKMLHIIRDHCYHSKEMMAGMWGIRKIDNKCINIQNLIKINLDILDVNSIGDQDFLRDYIYKENKDKLFIHTGKQYAMNDEGKPHLPGKEIWKTGGYFPDEENIKLLPDYDEWDEWIPELSFKKRNSINSFLCAHCREHHDVLIGNILEHYSEDLVEYLGLLFKKCGYDINKIDFQPPISIV